MELTPREGQAADLHCRTVGRAAQGAWPESTTRKRWFISAAILEGARDGRTVAELMTTAPLCWPVTRSWRACQMIPEIQVEATFGRTAPSWSPFISRSFERGKG